MNVSDTLHERGLRYGKFEDHAKIAQGLQVVLHEAPNWSKLDPDMRQALCVITDKMARILNGDPYYDDNWHDIQGYAKLVESRIKAIQQTAEDAEAEMTEYRKEIMGRLHEEQYQNAQQTTGDFVLPPNVLEMMDGATSIPTVYFSGETELNTNPPHFKS